MAMEKGNVITPKELIDRFQAAVVDNILKDVYHAGNPPMCRGFQCVPTADMDHIQNVNKIPDIGERGDMISAETILNGLIKTTHALTRVGTFSFIVKMKHTTTGQYNSGAPRPSSTTYSNVETKSGKVLFTTAHIKDFGRPANIEGTVYGNTIKSENLNQLFSNIYLAWSNTNRHKHEGHCIICHVVCHWNCHYNCHWNCHSDCHGWTIIRNK